MTSKKNIKSKLFFFILFIAGVLANANVNNDFSLIKLFINERSIFSIIGLKDYINDYLEYIDNYENEELCPFRDEINYNYNYNKIRLVNKLKFVKFDTFYENNKTNNKKTSKFNISLSDNKYIKLSLKKDADFFIHFKTTASIFNDTSEFVINCVPIGNSNNEDEKVSEFDIFFYVKNIEFKILYSNVNKFENRNIHNKTNLKNNFFSLLKARHITLNFDFKKYVFNYNNCNCKNLIINNSYDDIIKKSSNDLQDDLMYFLTCIEKSLLIKFLLKRQPIIKSNSLDVQVVNTNDYIYNFKKYNFFSLINFSINNFYNSNNLMFNTVLNANSLIKANNNYCIYNLYGNLSLIDSIDYEDNVVYFNDNDGEIQFFLSLDYFKQIVHIAKKLDNTIVNNKSEKHSVFDFYISIEDVGRFMPSVYLQYMRNQRIVIQYYYTLKEPFIENELEEGPMLFVFNTFSIILFLANTEQILVEINFDLEHQLIPYCKINSYDKDYRVCNDEVVFNDNISNYDNTNFNLKLYPPKFFDFYTTGYSNGIIIEDEVKNLFFNKILAYFSDTKEPVFLFDKENSMDFKFRIDKVITVNNTYNNQLNYLNSSYSKGILLVMKDKKDK